MLFELPNAVTSFNRWSKFAEALVRRLLACLFSMYFDDGTFQEQYEKGAEVTRPIDSAVYLLEGLCSMQPWKEC